MGIITIMNPFEIQIPKSPCRAISIPDSFRSK
jgi:hypothetical protein